MLCLPAVFQRLMQQVLNPEEGVPVYIDDILIFFDDHLQHLEASAGLRLKPSKCKFIRQTVEYLGHISHQGVFVQTRKSRTAVPKAHQCEGPHLYRRFVKGFADIAQLQANCRYGLRIVKWPSSRECAFPLPFTLETDASIKAVLSQRGGTMQAELAEILGDRIRDTRSHYHAYLYGHDVVVYTDHSAVKANPQANGKHARWWSQVYCSGIKNLEIVYRAGRDIANADALSRAPVTQPVELVTGVQIATIWNVRTSCRSIPTRIKLPSVVI